MACEPERVVIITPPMPSDLASGLGSVASILWAYVWSAASARARLRVVSCCKDSKMRDGSKSGPQKPSGLPEASLRRRRAAKKMQVAQAVQAITAHAALSCRDCWRRFGLEKKNFDGILSENKSALPGEPGGRFHFLASGLLRFCGSSSAAAWRNVSIARLANVLHIRRVLG